jgi:hypothetical protein
VAEKVTGEPVRPDAVAVRVFAPVIAPRVHVGEVAMPSEPVVTVAGEPRVPPPGATANVTETPATGALPAPVTMTAGAVETAVPGGAVWLFPADTAIVVAVTLAWAVGSPVSDAMTSARAIDATPTARPRCNSMS